LLIDVAAVTGARLSQLTRIEVQDVQTDPPRIVMPSSKKGHGQKKGAELWA
jgi:integrase